MVSTGLGGAALALTAAAHADAVNARAGADATIRHTFLLGRSIDGRTITAVETGAPDTQNKTLVVGCIHGDERARIAIAKRLISTGPPAETDLWIITNLNPDGAAAGRRQCKRGRPMDQRRRRPEPDFRALVEATASNVQIERGVLNRSLRLLRETTGLRGAELAAEIVRHARAYRRFALAHNWSLATPTASALVKHWGRVGA